MADGLPTGDDGSDDSQRLSIDAIRYLRRLGDARSAAPNPGEQAEITALLLRVARNHRAAGIGWDQLAVAIGVARDEVLGWQRAETDRKPRPTHRESPRSVQAVDGHAGVPPDRTMRTDISQHITATMSAESRQVSAAVGNHYAVATLASTGQHARRVLFTSGDSRHGGNKFDLEAAAVRQRMHPTGIDVREIGCLALHELTRLLDEHRPAVLHIAAHSAFGGIHLSLDGEVLSVGTKAFEATVLRGRPPPRLVVLNLCESAGTAAALAAGATPIAAIGWPSLVDDDQARMFNNLLYPALAANTTIETALRDTAPTLGERWPALELPRGFGTVDCPVFTGRPRAQPGR